MKTKMMKRTLSTILTLSMIIGLFVCMPVSATSTDPTVEYLYYEDFEGQTVDSAPTGIYSGATNNKYTDETKTAVAATAAVVKSDTDHGKYLELIPVDTTIGEAKIFFTEAVDKNDGTIVIEYDGLINLENSDAQDSRKWIYASFTNSDRTTIHQTKEILNHKGSDAGNMHGFQEYHYTLGTTLYNGTADRFLPQNYAKTQNLLRTNNTWQHYKLEINLATGEQQLWLDGVISEVWRDKELYTKASAASGAAGYSIDAILLMNKLQETNNTNWLLDNIKVYKKDTAETSPFSSITQDSATGVVTASFTNAMSSTGIALYDADGNNVTQEVSLSQDGKTAEITPNGEETKGLYYVKVGKYAGGTAPAQTEKTVELDWTWTMPPATYLYFEDFEGENQVVDSAPTGIYSGETNNKYTDESKTAIASTYAVVKNEETEGIGNYLEILPAATGTGEANSEKAKMFFAEAVDKNDGTIVIEYDGLINLESSDPEDSRKYIYAAYTNSDRTTINQTKEILNHKGSDVGNMHGFQEYDYTLGETTYGGTNTRFLPQSYNGANLLRTNNTWQHYKLEINLATGEQQLWLDGVISKVWRDKELYTKVAVDGQSLDAILFMNYFKNTNNTNWKLDNIKVYRKDTEVTSPFANTEITSKGGSVTVGFTSAVTAADVSVYNADGVKQSGDVTVSEDGMTATFKPSTAMADGLYYVKLAKLADGTVTPQTEKTFTYAPGKTEVAIVIPDSVTFTSGSTITPTYTLTHTDGTTGTIKMIVAAYKEGRMTQAILGEGYDYTAADYSGTITAPTLTLTEDADTIKAFAWNMNTLAPFGIADVATLPAQ